MPGNITASVSESPQAYFGNDQHEEDARRQGYKGTFQGAQWSPNAQDRMYGKAANTLQSGFSGQSDPTTEYQNQIRSAAQARIGGLQNNAQGRKEMLKADLEQGFANQAAQLRRGAAGTGAQASLGYGRAAGDLANKFQQNLSRGMLDVETQAGNELGQMGNIGQQLFAQELANRQQQYNQAQDLSNLYMDFAGVEGGRQAEESARSAALTQARKDAQSQLMGSAGQAIGYHMGGQSGQDAAQSYGGIASMFAGSDINMKKDISPAVTEIRSFLSELKPYQYEYKEPRHGVGKHYSVMAQDLQKHPVGRSMVIDTPDGLIVDYARGFAVILASQADLNQRFNKIENVLEAILNNLEGK